MEIVYTIDPAILPNVTAERLAYNKLAAFGNAAPGATNNVSTDEEFVKLQLDMFVRECVKKHGILPAPPPPPPVVLDRCTRRQAIQALINTNRLHLVQPCIDAMPTTTDLERAQKATIQNEWDNSTEFHLNRPTLRLLALTPTPNGLGMTEQELIDLFVLAVTL